MTKIYIAVVTGGVFLFMLASLLLSPPHLNAEKPPTGEPISEGPLVDAWGNPMPNPWALWKDYPPVVNKGQKYLPTSISFYQGDGYKKKWNKCRLSIRQSESGNVYGGVSGTGTYKGAYQFSDAFAVGMGWMIQKSMRDQGVIKEQAVFIGEKLRKTPTHRWDPFYQDWAFWMGWNDGKGKHHWPNTRRHSTCP